MRTGYMLLFQNAHQGLADVQRVKSEMRMAAAAQDFVEQQAWGTPQQILDKLEKRRRVIGDFESNICTSYAGLPFKDAEASLRLFAKEVLPEIRSWGGDAFEPVRAA